MVSPFDDPESAQLFTELLHSLTTESHRGAVLVGTAHIDNCLADLWKAMLPAGLSSEKRRQLLRYPGPLSSFAARIEVAYAARLLPRHVYDALNALRALRNDVAHSPESFTLIGQEDRYHPIFKLGPDLPSGVRRLAFDLMLEMKTANIIDALSKLRETDPAMPDIIKDKRDAAEYASKRPELMKVLEQELPHWELSIGLALLGSMLIRARKENAKVLGAGTIAAIPTSHERTSEQEGAT